MRRRRLGGLAAALLVGLTSAVATSRGGDYLEENTPEATGLLSGMFHEKPRKQANNKQANNAKNVAEVRPRPTATVEMEAAEQQRHKNALIRRMEVCDRLRMIANQTGNEALMDQANQLEERANAIYRQQTSRMPLPAQAPLAVLADDRTNPGSDRQKAENAPLFQGRTGGGTLLGGSTNQREQAILNGTNMGGN